MHTTSIDIYIQSLCRIPWIPKWHSCQNSKAARLTMIAREQTKLMKKILLINALYCSLRAWKLHRMQLLKCIFAVCALTLAFLKVSIRVCRVCMEHIACHLGHFTPLRNAIQSICQRSTSVFSAAVCNTLHHGTLEILQLCHLGICVYTMEAHTGLTMLP